jgi:hypothetical protein
MGKNEIYKKDENGNMVLVSSVEVADEAQPPNWLGLEQDLRYSSVFGRRSEADPIDFNIFTTTLVNGKLGHASENALVYAFSILGIAFTSGEKDLINGLLAKHNFVFRLT